MTQTQKISRRTLVAGLGPAIPVSAVAATVPALAGTDPIFGAIEAHRVAADERGTVAELRQETWERICGAETPAGRDDAWERFETDPAGRDILARQRVALQTEEDAFLALIATKPTTPAGLVALATYGVELDRDGAVCIGAPAPLRILAAIAGIPEENAPLDDDEDEA